MDPFATIGPRHWTIQIHRATPLLRTMSLHWAVPTDIGPKRNGCQCRLSPTGQIQLDHKRPQVPRPGQDRKP